MDTLSKTYDISIHAPVKGATPGTAVLGQMVKFQSTLP